jgi:hypothetical protein
MILIVEVPNLAQANMWTRKDMKEFKEQIRKEKDAVIKVGSGETVTVGSHTTDLRADQSNSIRLGPSTDTRRWSLHLLGVQHRLL